MKLQTQPTNKRAMKTTTQVSLISLSPYNSILLNNNLYQEVKPFNDGLGLAGVQGYFYPTRRHFKNCTGKLENIKQTLFCSLSSYKQEFISGREKQEGRLQCPLIFLLACSRFWETVAS